MNELLLLLEAWVDDELCRIPIYDLLLELGYPNIAELWFKEKYAFNGIFLSSSGRKIICGVIKDGIKQFEGGCKHDKDIFDYLQDMIKYRPEQYISNPQQYFTTIPITFDY